MKEKELQFFRSLLLKNLRALDRQHRVWAIPRLADGNSDSIDQASAEFERDLFFQFHERESSAIKEIYRALGRVEEGTFGICEDCGERISQRRLRANPSATLCLECQKMKEREEKINIPNGRGLRIFLEA
ncbi:MAG: TraR/DksA family transcriptional regulator [Thermodesulfobacteriota bacterium]